MTVPPHKNRTPEQILVAERLFESAWHFWQALSWLDYAKRKTNISALQYAALELRQGIEHLWFDTNVWVSRSNPTLAPNGDTQVYPTPILCRAMETSI